MNPVTQAVAWHHARFRVPEDWEITSYSIERREGRLEFSTRRGFQGLISWESCKGAPDSESMMTSFLNRTGRPDATRRAVGPGDLTTQRAGRFLLGHRKADQPCQAIAHLPEEQKILRWVFAAASPQLVRDTFIPILESFKPNNGPVLDYAVYGLRFRLPASYTLEKMTVLPADVTLVFESDCKTRATFRRWGLPDLVLGGRSLETFYATFLRTQACLPSSVQLASIAGMDAVVARYEQHGEHHLDRFMGRHWTNGEARLWYDRAEERLYALEQIGPRNEPLPAFTDIHPHLQP